MDDKDIGTYTSGLVPIRPANVDQDLPVDGRGKEEWRSFVAAKDHPQGIDPPSGEIVNWNNRPQAGYEAPDDNWSLGAVERVDLLLRDLGTGIHLTAAKMVSAMNEAATQDVREVTFEPLLSRLLHGGHAPSARDAEMVSLLDAWHAHGSSRLDRTDPSGIGPITDPGAAIMDTAWPLLANAWASSVLDSSLRRQLSANEPQFDAPFRGPLQPSGREQTKGWHIYGQGHPHDPRGPGPRQVPRSLLWRGQPSALSRGALARARSSWPEAGRNPGHQCSHVALERHARADLVRSGIAVALHDALRRTGPPASSRS
jgi:Penicillin amidase